MKIATSATLFTDAVGMRMSITFSEVDDETGKIISDNNRMTRVVTDTETRQLANEVLAKAQEYVEG